jgi:hypothetical protein
MHLLNSPGRQHYLRSIYKQEVGRAGKIKNVSVSVSLSLSLSLSFSLSLSLWLLLDSYRWVRIINFSLVVTSISVAPISLQSTFPAT